MPKRIHCARCGRELIHSQKGVPSLGITITVVKPHECGEDIAEDGFNFLEGLGTEPTAVPTANLSNEPFVRKLDKATQKTKLITPLKDRRPDRQEVSSTAPQNLRGMIDTMTGRMPSENSGQEYTEDDSERGDNGGAEET